MKYWRVLNTVILSMLIASLTFGPVFAVTEQRQVQSEDIRYGPSTETWTSTGGREGHYVSYPYAGSTIENAAVIDVRAYGATGDGVTDDTSAIDAAISAASSTQAQTVLFPRGTYKIGPLATI